MFSCNANHCWFDLLFIALRKSIAHFLNPWFVCFAVLFISHQIAQWILKVQLKCIDSYLDPVLMMPISLHILLWERRYCLGRTGDYTFSKSMLLYYFLLVSILFEIVFPAIQPKFIADWLDVLCYGLGTFFFYFWMNKKNVG